MSKAEPVDLPEYASNAFIAALPPVRSTEALAALLSRPPRFSPDERRMPGHLRKHCIMRLARFMEPLKEQLELAERVDLVLRQGYVGRDPGSGRHLKHTLNNADRADAGALGAEVSQAVENTACSFSLLGCPGMGKSRSIECILRTYPQVIKHSWPRKLTQVVWLKIDCPIRGSERQLCIAFFKELDRLLGTRHQKDYCGSRVFTDEMLLNMAQVANTHALGLLVLDEVQHLNTAKGGPRAILNFLVSLVNVVGIPIVLVGTMGGRNVIQDNFREARRATGVGSPIWDRYARGGMWDYFVAEMWKYQWTRDETPLTEELKEVLYDESQGIVDVVIKLFMLAQFRAIGRGGGGRELLTPRLLRRVAAEEFQIIQPMMEALRRGDKRALEVYDDLQPFQRHVEARLGLAAHRQVDAEDLQRMSEAGKAAARRQESPAGDPEGLIRSLLENSGVAEDVAFAVVGEAKRLHPSGDPFLMIAAIKELLEGVPQSRPKRAAPRAAAAPVEGDLRDAVARGRAVGLAAHDALLDAGAVAAATAAIAAA